MADEFTLSHRLTLENASDSVTLAEGPTSITQSTSNPKRIQNVQLVGTSAEAVLLGDVTAPGLMELKNLDATNFVKLRMGASGADVLKILPGESYVIRLASTNPYLIADTVSVPVRVTVFDT